MALRGQSPYYHLSLTSGVSPGGFRGLEQFGPVGMPVSYIPNLDPSGHSDEPGMVGAQTSHITNMPFTLKAKEERVLTNIENTIGRPEFPFCPFRIRILGSTRSVGVTSAGLPHHQYIVYSHHRNTACFGWAFEQIAASGSAISPVSNWLS